MRDINNHPVPSFPYMGIPAENPARAKCVQIDDKAESNRFALPVDVGLGGRL